MNVAVVRVADLPRMWPLVAPVIAAAIRKGPGGWTPEMVRAEVESGRWVLLVATEPGRVRAVACCGAVTEGADRVLWVHLAGGAGLADGVAAMLPALQALARANQCKRMGFQGRRGWMRSAAMQAFRHAYDVAFMEVDP